MDWGSLAASALDKAGSAASFTKGAATGVKDGVMSLAEGVWSLGKAGYRAAGDPVGTFDKAKSLAGRAADYGGRLIDDPSARKEAYEKVQQLAGSLKQQFVDARDLAEREGRLAEFYGNVAGRGGFEVGTFIIPAAKLGALGKAGTAAKGAEAAELAKVAEVSQVLKAERAGQAVQVCETSEKSEFLVARHGDMPTPRSGQQSHHGVMSAWMEKNFPGYDPNLAPAVLMPEANHRATFGVYNTWRAEMRKELGGSFDWARVSETQMRTLSEKMFDAAKVPSGSREQYWDWFTRMKGALTNE